MVNWGWSLSHVFFFYKLLSCQWIFPLHFILTFMVLIGCFSNGLSDNLTKLPSTNNLDHKKIQTASFLWNILGICKEDGTWGVVKEVRHTRLKLSLRGQPHTGLCYSLSLQLHSAKFTYVELRSRLCSKTARRRKYFGLGNDTNTSREESAFVAGLCRVTSQETSRRLF